MNKEYRTIACRLDTCGVTKYCTQVCLRMRYRQIHRNNTHKRDDNRPTLKISIGKPKERDGSEGVGINGIIILKRILKKKGARTRSSFSWLRITYQLRVLYEHKNKTSVTTNN
jgi:hypothetical protein